MKVRRFFGASRPVLCVAPSMCANTRSSKLMMRNREYSKCKSFDFVVQCPIKIDYMELVSMIDFA